MLIIIHCGLIKDGGLTVNGGDCIVKKGVPQIIVWRLVVSLNLPQ